MIAGELPPTAGLPLRWQDFFGPGETSLEELLAAYLGTTEPVIASSGTACIVLALELLKRVSTRKKVIIPAYSCALVLHAIEKARLEAVICDVQANHFDFDFARLAELVDRDTLCVMPTHLGGIPADVQAAAMIAQRVGAYIVEDAAQSLGARVGDRFAGTLGDLGVFSLTRGKGLSIYEGGFLTLSNPALRQVAKDVAETLLPERPLAESLKSLELVGLMLFYNRIGLRLTYGAQLRFWLRRGRPDKAVGDVVASDIELHKVSLLRKRVGANAFQRLGPWISHCQRQAEVRIERLGKIPSLRVIVPGEDCSATYSFLMLLFDEPADCAEVLTRLWTSGLGVTKLFCNSLGDAKIAPNASSFASRCLTISNSPMLSDGDFEQVFATIEAVVKARRQASQRA